MPSYLEITKLAIRRVTIDIRGVKIQITENLMRDPEIEKAAKKRVDDSINGMRDIIAQLREEAAKKKAETSAIITVANPKILTVANPKAKRKPKPKAEADTEDDAESTIAQMETLVKKYELDYSEDDRELACRSFCARVRESDLTAEDNLPLPLEPAALYATQVPTQLLLEVIAELNKVPIVPEAKRSPSKDASIGS